VLGPGQIALVSALGWIRRILVDQVALHAVGVGLRIDAIVAAEQSRQARMTDWDVEMVGIIVAQRLPVELAWTHRDAAEHAQILETIRRNLLLVWRHHLSDRRRAGLERDEQETAPIFQRDRKQAELFGLETRIFVAMRDPDQPAVTTVAPGVIGTGQHPGAAGGAVDQARAAVAADIRERSYLTVVAADHDHAFAEIFQAAPFARPKDLALVADDLRGGAQERFLLGLEKLGIKI